MLRLLPGTPNSVSISNQPRLLLVVVESFADDDIENGPSDLHDVHLS